MKGITEFNVYSGALIYSFSTKGRIFFSLLINVISTLFRRPETNIVFSMFFQLQLNVISDVGSAQRNPPASGGTVEFALLDPSCWNIKLSNNL